MWLSSFFTNDWAQDIVATLITFAVALAWLRLMDTLAARGVFAQAISRKLIHIGTGPIFVLCWPLFSPQPAARFLAALVPLAITAQFVLVGAGVIKDPAAVKAMSRTGDRREILRGPLYYGIVFVVCTLAFWRTSPVGILALMLMCGGDGLADLVGRKWGTAKLPIQRREVMGRLGCHADRGIRLRFRLRRPVQRVGGVRSGLEPARRGMEDGRHRGRGDGGRGAAPA